MDIFNEKDLLAIANDSSSSSCANNNSTDETSVASDEFIGDAIGDNDVCNQREDTKPPAVRNPAAEDDDSDDEDAGLLETWFTDLKSRDDLQDETLKSTAREESDVNLHAETHPDNDYALGNESENSTGDASQSVSDNIVQHNSQDREKSHDCAVMQLGSSVYDWISKYNSNQRRKSSRVDLDSARIIGIEKDLNVNETWPASLVVDFKEIAEENISKRTGAAHQNIAIIRAVGVDATSDSKKFKGDATASSPDHRNADTMVDCVAKYNHKKNCYTLEMVDMTITHLQPHSRNNDVICQDLEQNSEPAIDIGVASSEESKQNILDPRTLAKQAEAQIKKLKRGKRKSAGKERAIKEQRRK